MRPDSFDEGVVIGHGAVDNKWNIGHSHRYAEELLCSEDEKALEKVAQRGCRNSSGVIQDLSGCVHVLNEALLFHIHIAVTPDLHVPETPFLLPEQNYS